MKAGTFIAIIITVIAATLLFYAIVHQVSSVWLDMMLRPDVRDVIDHSLADQKSLRRFDSANEARYRSRFDTRRRLKRGKRAKI